MTPTIFLVLAYLCISFYIFMHFGFMWDLEEMDPRLARMLKFKSLRVPIGFVLGLLWLPLFATTLICAIVFYIRDRGK